ncbi:hypothetical protein ACFWJT_27810 [Streptomyces sp. NPDC127069]|uniref:hypothetical protein n=1 Tax=Streptomyces sp. NPDC127069 TaxID=3347128 RepID=UPI0036557024
MVTGTRSASGRTVLHWPRGVTDDGSVPLKGGVTWPPFRPDISTPSASEPTGRAVATGDRATGACEVDGWKDLVALSAGSYHTVGVTASGRVLAAGDNSHGQYEVGDWRDIVAVAAGSTHTLGLRANGTVVTAGNNADRKCEVDVWSGVQLP